MFFFLALSSLLLISATFVIMSRNPVYAVLFLILTFCNATSLLLLLELEFLPTIFIIIYVGAIAVLFLFVLMMLNIKITELKAQSAQVAVVTLVIAAIFLFETFILLRFNFVSIKPCSITIDFMVEFLTNPVFAIDSSTAYNTEHNIRSIGY